MSRNNPRATVRSWAPGRLPDDVRRSIDALARADDVRHIAIMPDVHLGRNVCVGTAFATTERIFPDAIGGDIGCGMSAAAIDAQWSEESARRAAEMYRIINDAIPIHRQRSEAARALAARVPPACELSAHSLKSLAESEGPMQFGTLGTGNHFFELQRDEHDRLWLMVHSGSRGLGQAIRAYHLDSAQRGRGGHMFLRSDSSAGEAYLRDMEWARRFAAASRRAMLDAVGAALDKRLGWRLVDASLFDCDHNHIHREEHFGESHFVHRKGAMAAWDGAPGIVPGSMATASFHVTGRGVAEALCSSAHGAGRAMSRNEARRRVSRGRLLRELENVYADPGAAAGLREEAPSAYKDIHAVMRAQRKLVRIVRTLTPILTHKGVAK